MLRVNLLPFIYFATCASSVFSVVSNSVRSFPFKKILLSSAYNRKFNTLLQRVMSLMNIKNSIGPRNELLTSSLWACSLRPISLLPVFKAGKRLKSLLLEFFSSPADKLSGPVDLFVSCSSWYFCISRSSVLHISRGVIPLGGVGVGCSRP